MEEKVDSMFFGHDSMPQTLDPTKRLGRQKVDEMPLTRVPPPRPSPDKSPSPNKRHVSFPPRLERGPTPSSPHRNLSPSRSALSARAAIQDARAEEQLLAKYDLLRMVDLPTITGKAQMDPTRTNQTRTPTLNYPIRSNGQTRTH